MSTVGALFFISSLCLSIRVQSHLLDLRIGRRVFDPLIVEVFLTGVMMMMMMMMMRVWRVGLGTPWQPGYALDLRLPFRPRLRVRVSPASRPYHV